MQTIRYMAKTAGAGFAVVADEVRSLAQRSAQAAKETALKIEESVAKAGHGVQVTARVNDALQHTIANAGKVAKLIAEIATASREQAQGITQINTAVSQMDKVTQSNAANAEESAAAAEELNAQAESMKEAVCNLLQLVNGATAARARGAAARPESTSCRLRSIKPAKHTTSNCRNGGNGHHAPAPPALTAPARQTAPSAIPMEGAFKEF